MTTFYVTEFARLQVSPDGIGQMGQDPPLADYSIAIGGSSVAGQVLNVATRFVRLHTDSPCSFSLNLNPVAVATKSRMAANQTEYRSIPPGAGFAVAVITNS